MRINTLLDMISQTHIAAGGLRVGDFVKNKKTGVQGVVILAKTTSGKIKAKAKVWLTNGKVAMFQNVQNYQKIGTPSMFSIDVLNEDENTFQIELANVGADETKSDESESEEEKEEDSESDFSIDSPPQASPGQDPEDSDFSIDSPPQASPGQDPEDSDFSVDSPPQASPGRDSVERNSEDVDFLSAVQNIRNREFDDWTNESEKIEEYFTVPTDGEEKVVDADDSYDTSYDASYMSDASEEKVNDTRLSLSRTTSIADSDEDYEASYFSCLQNLEQTRAMAQAIAQRAYQMGQIAQLQNQNAVRNAAMIEDE
jgi:hypothetical protein